MWWGNGPGWFHQIGEVLMAIGSFFVGVIVFLIWLAVLVLVVRFLLIATRAAKVYLRKNGEHDGVLPQRMGAGVAPAAPAAPAPAATTTRTRGAKTPPAV
jgi:hypothetical protein